ncbi:phosphotransferase family protein [Bacillus mesophilus]|uniref:Phosphotransferase family protein n=1 Tax=Bacillus mesophilus TaxID=1808955 RepID=A0A6M0Q6N8_9BACI|nr:phosphotransferase family protein [Bacillus mesophilus]
MEDLLGKEWDIHPAGGATGEAYFAKFEDKRLFLKRNSSPFLAVLSAEGIVPKLVWTKRLENGDVITAQHWLDGRELKPIDMKNPNVAKLLNKIHSSKELLDMLMRIGKAPLMPQELLSELVNTPYFVQASQDNHLINQAIQSLHSSIDQIDYSEYVVCHCDMNHNNWLLTDQDQLFLIDWDGAMVADPAIDIGMLLYSYIPELEWEEWMSHYGLTLDDSLRNRMKWYVIYQTILSIQWFDQKQLIQQRRYAEHYLTTLLG